MASQSLNMPYLLVSGAFIIAIAFGFAVARPAFQVIQDTQKSIDSSRADLEKRQEFLRTLDSKIAELEINRDNEAQLSTILPQKERMEDALRILHRAAEGAGLQIEQVTNDTEATQAAARGAQARGEGGAPPKGVVPLSVSVSFLAPYQSFRNFVSTIEKTPRLMDITSISLQRDQKDPNLLLGKVSINFYSVTAPAEE